MISDRRSEIGEQRSAALHEILAVEEGLVTQEHLEDATERRCFWLAGFSDDPMRGVCV